MADDLGYGDISPYDGWIETPHLEQLAAEGMRFTNFYASGPVCSPTRAGLLTGRYQQRAGIPGVVFADPTRNRNHGLQMSEQTLAEALKEAGYATGIFGKWHLGYERKYNPVHQGFDVFRGYVSGNVDFFGHVDDGPGLYNLAEDLEEMHNLADEEPERVAALRSLFARWKEAVTNDATPQPDMPVEMR